MSDLHGFIFAVLALFMTTMAWADITGSGISSDPYILNTAADRANFATNDL